MDWLFGRNVLKQTAPGHISDWQLNASKLNGLAIWLKRAEPSSLRPYKRLNGHAPKPRAWPLSRLYSGD